MNDLEYIAQSCRDDERLLNIVKDVANMSGEEREDFVKKVRQYFLGKNSEEDNNAYKFFKIILEDENARKILEILGEK
ncbi:hypothetical protein [Thermosipho globiformans]|uniref:hypothetical protein n=1 Tax=Thermosipho globiformans TaxID=380685 RepID=UPI000F8E08EA|nr:hypothetical protein [Thermosipho globiformans]